MVPLDVIFTKMEESRTLYTDTLLEMLGARFPSLFPLICLDARVSEIEHDGRINFGGFILMITTYCLFEPPEMLKCKIFNENQ